MKTNLRIGEVLMERNYITQEQMEQALAYQKEHREKRVGQILIELGFVTGCPSGTGNCEHRTDAGRSDRCPHDSA